MNYGIFKLEFRTGVHFGQGTLDDSDYVFRADTLFSALYIEALKMGKADVLFQKVMEGTLLFSNALPYVGETYLVPKPMLRVETGQQVDSIEKKKYKNIRYLPIENLTDYLCGQWMAEENPMKQFGQLTYATRMVGRGDGALTRYQVATYYYNEGNGVYLIVVYQTLDELALAEELLTALSYGGIGGERSSGLGRFRFSRGRCDLLVEKLKQPAKQYMLLSDALPRNAELETALEGARYLLEKRAGYMTPEWDVTGQFRKKEMYVFAEGSCFEHRFDGGIYNVAIDAPHPIYRYAKALFLGVR